MNYHEKAAHLNHVLTLVETAPAYVNGEQWAVDAALRLRADAVKAKEMSEGVKALARSQRTGSLSTNETYSST